jgi:hypothetical protein
MSSNFLIGSEEFLGISELASLSKLWLYDLVVRKKMQIFHYFWYIGISMERIGLVSYAPSLKM